MTQEVCAGLGVGSRGVRGPRQDLTWSRMRADCGAGWRHETFGAVDGVRHIQDLSLELVDVSKGCRSGGSDGRVSGSLRCAQDSAFWGEATAESETGARVEEIYQLQCAFLNYC